MPVIATTLATEIDATPSPHPLLEKILRALMPAATLDFEPLYSKVRLWWVEVDPEGIPQRELGFDDAGVAIVAGPIGKNLGFWTDSHMTFDPAENTVVQFETFNLTWADFERRWPGCNECD